ncbi:MAG: OmpA family protein [Aliarcobacter sp.]|nr:OmpA family protein [Aliarcobacter sp.]
MTLLRKIIMLLIFFLILNIFTIYGFEYKDFLSNNNASLNEKINLNTTNEKQEAKPFNLVLVKKDGVVEMNGLFSNENDVKMISDILNINRQGEYKYEENRVVNEELLKELVVLITPFKDFFADNSKLTVLNNEVTLLGELKDANYKTLLDSIISRSKINIKTDITLPGVSNIADNKEINNPTSNINEVQLLINNILSAKKINFERRSTAITAESKTVVEEIAKILNDNPTLKVEISGHTDSRGSDSLNKKISQDRASSVRDILISLGINKDRVTAIGYGEEKPLVQDDENGLSEINRRVEFNILGENK